MLTAYLAETPADLEAAFALRYVQYRQLGTIPEVASGLFHDHFDEVGHVRMLGVRTADGRTVATVRILVSHGPATPLCADELFAPELEAMGRSATQPVYEVTRLAISNEFRNNPEPLYRLLARLAYMAHEDNPAFIVAPARRRQAESYKRLLGLEDVAPERVSPTQQVSLAFVGAPYERAFAYATRRYRHLFPETCRSPASVV